MEPKFSKAMLDAMLDQMIHGTGVVYVDLAGMTSTQQQARDEWQHLRSKILRDMVDSAKTPGLPPGGIIAPQTTQPTDAERQQQIKDLMDHVQKQQKVWGLNGGLPGWAMTPQMIIEPPPPEPPKPVEKPVKRMDEMTFADFRKGVDAWWDKRPR